MARFTTRDTGGPREGELVAVALGGGDVGDGGSVFLEALAAFLRELAEEVGGDCKFRCGLEEEEGVHSFAEDVGVFLVPGAELADEDGAVVGADAMAAGQAAAGEVVVSVFLEGEERLDAGIDFILGEEHENGVAHEFDDFSAGAGREVADVFVVARKQGEEFFGRFGVCELDVVREVGECDQCIDSFQSGIPFV